MKKAVLIVARGNFENGASVSVFNYGSSIHIVKIKNIRVVVMDKVRFTQENGARCICGRCPVQAKSKCSKEKMEKIMEMMESQIKGAMPKPAEVPFLYCSGGKAACKDLDMKQMCICGSCPVWAQFRLMSAKPSMYFCREGKAK